MNAQENNLSQGDNGDGVLALIQDIREGIRGAEIRTLEEANHLLSNISERLLEVKDDVSQLLQVQQERLESQFAHQHMVEQQQPQESPQQDIQMNLTSEWGRVIENDWNPFQQGETHRAHVKGFLNHIAQTVDDDDVFRVIYVNHREGPPHDLVWTVTVYVRMENENHDVRMENENHDPDQTHTTFSAIGIAKNKKKAAEAAIFNVFEQDRSNAMLHMYYEIMPSLE